MGILSIMEVILNQSAKSDARKKSRNFACKLCQYAKYPTSERLLKHLLEVHADVSRSCRYCSRCFFRKEDFVHHMNKHKNEDWNVFKCTFCPRSFFTRKNLLDHQKHHEFINNFEDGFYTTAAVENDSKMEFAEKEKKDKLTECLQGVVDAQDGVPKIGAPNKAAKTPDDQTISYLESLEKLRESKATLNMLACPQCERLFSNKFFLSRHIELHRKRNLKYKYVCKYCGLRYIKPDQLFRHYAKSHKKETPFSCQICNESFSVKPDFSNHIKIAHNDSGKIKFLDDGSIVYVVKPGASGIVKDLQTVEIDTSIVENINCKDLNGEREKTDEYENLELDFVAVDVDESFIQNCLEENTDLLEKYNASSEEEDHILTAGKTDGVVDRKNVKSAKSVSNIANKRRRVNRRKKFIEDSDGEDWDEDDLAPLREFQENLNSNPKQRKSHTEYCKICDARLKSTSMKKHMLLHQKRKCFRCHICKITMKDEYKFHLHTKTHFEKDKFLCVCGVRLKSEEAFEEHKKRVHSKDVNTDLTLVRNIYTKENDGVNLKESQILVKKGNEQPSSFNLKLSPGAVLSNVIYSDVDQPTASLKTTPPANTLKFVNNATLGRKLNFTIKVISPQEAKHTNKLVIKPVNVGGRSSNFKSSPATVSQVNKNVRVNPITPNVESNTDFSALMETYEGGDAKNPARKKFLKVNMNTAKGNVFDAVPIDDFKNAKLVHSNPLAHLIKNSDQLPSNNKPGGKKKKEVDYMAIIKKSLLNLR